MKLGVRFDTTRPLLDLEFRRAMDFWAGVLDMEWHLDNTPTCAIRVTDGPPDEFEADDIAEAESLDEPAFHGEIAFNPAVFVHESELYNVCIHEIGHLFGLEHNPSTASLMHYLEIDETQKLDESDIAALAVRHKMRNSGNTDYDPSAWLELRAGMGQFSINGQQMRAGRSRSRATALKRSGIPIGQHMAQ